MRILAALAAASGLIAGSAQAQNFLVLEPSSDWVMNYADDSCALQRQFGEEGQQAFLEMREFGGPGRTIQFTIASKDFRRSDGEFSVAIQPFDPKPVEWPGFNVRLDAAYQGKMFVGQIGANDPRMVAARRKFISETPLLSGRQRELLLQAADNLQNSRVMRRLVQDPDLQQGSMLVSEAYLTSPLFLENLAEIHRDVEAIQIDGAFSRKLSLRTGELSAAMQAMRTCLDELQSHWGIDVEAHRSLTRQVRPLNREEFAAKISENYPAEMIRKGMEGYLRVRLNVSAAGEPTACHLQSPLNDEVFNRTACSGLMRLAKFSPALDAEGQPIASFYQTSVIYTFSRR